MARFFVNADHVATVREARKIHYPSPVRAALLAEDEDLVALDKRAAVVDVDGGVAVCCAAVEQGGVALGGGGREAQVAVAAEPAGRPPGDAAVLFVGVPLVGGVADGAAGGVNHVLKGARGVVGVLDGLRGPS